MKRPQTVIKEWYKDGLDKRGKFPYEVGMFDGTFHYLSDIEKVENGVRFGIDFGSAEKGDAMANLDERLKEIGYKTNKNFDGRYEWVYATKIGNVKKTVQKNL